ncbi:MAG: hypothetical protein KJO07_04460, partial [Deltaproteobacteria bacterium]|nr:hypothetical protein [Deltaproteobacteria bacterium]
MILRLVSACLLLALACNGAAPGPTVKRSSEGQKSAAPKLNLPQLPADQREKLLSQGIKMMLEGEHLRHRPVDDKLSKAAFDEYIEALDPGKLFLLADHVAQLRSYSDQLDDQLRAGNLELARVGAALLKERRGVVAKIISERLAKPFDFSKDEHTETDPEKVGYAQDDRELADRWRKVLKLQ